MNSLNTGGGRVSASDLADLAKTVRDYGALGDGSADDTVAFQAAASAGRPVLVPWRATPYRLSSTINLSDGTVFYGTPGARPEIQWVGTSTARIFDALGRTGAGLVNLAIDGGKDTAPTGAAIRYRDCVRCVILDCHLTNLPGDSTGSVVFSGTSTRCRFEDNYMEDCEGTGLGLTGASVSRNRVHHNDFLRTGYFGIRVGEGANRNIISENTGEDTGIELIGIAYGSDHNIINGNHAEGAGDNGISLVGRYNVAVGNHCERNLNAGIGIWGSYNVAAGNVLINNTQADDDFWAGAWIGNGYGGTGQYNTVLGNVTDDNQASLTQNWTVRIGSNSYTSWAAGQVVAIGEYRLSGMHIYKAASAGTTGATAPTHTSGDASDGAVTWTYMDSHLNAATPRINTIAFNTPGRNKSGQRANDASSWVNNMLFDYQDTRWNAPKLVVVNIPTSASGLASGQLWCDTANSNVIKKV